MRSKEDVMKTIRKYPVTESTELPAGAEILTVQKQKGSTFVWAIVDTEQTETQVLPGADLLAQLTGGFGGIVRLETGREMPPLPLAYVGTAVADNGDVDHFFRIEAPPAAVATA
jgi:hypothetical protein